MPEEKLSATQLALRALERCDANAETTLRLAESVQAQAITNAAFQGKVLEHMKNQDKVNNSVAEVITNHIPHIVEQLGESRGRDKIIMWVLAAIITLIITMGLLNAVIT